MKQRIVVVSAFSGTGGIGRWLKLALPDLAREFELRVVLKYGASELQHELGGAVAVEQAALQSPARAFGAVPLWRAIRSHRADLVLVHDPFSMLGLCLLRAFGLLRRTPLIVVVHSAASEFAHVAGWKRRVVQTAAALALGPLDCVVAVSHYVATHLQRTPLRRRRMRTLHNGVHSSPGARMERPPVPPLTVAFVGRLSREKGADRLAEVVSRLRDAPIEWHVAGAGALDHGMREALAADVTAGRVQLHGWVRDPAALLRGVHVLIVISRTEGCPFSVLEAHASGTLVLSLRVGGMPEALDDGAAGVLVEDLDAMAAELRRLAAGGLSATAPLRQRAGELMRERYGFDAMIQRYSALIHELVDDAGTRKP